jgi:Spy/CpxP family protein refolding chaperone
MTKPGTNYRNRVLQVGFAGAVAACLWQAAALAAPVATTLIDKEFDAAVGKFMAKRFCKRIDATSEQTEKLTAMISQTRDDTRPLREQLRHGLLDLSSMVVSDDTTDDQIKAKVAELRSIHEKISDVRLDTALKARRVLTHEQREKINKRITNLITGEALPDMINRRVGMLE